MSKNVSRTLLSINRDLKEKSMNKTKKNRIVFRIWTKKRNRLEFESEASTLNFFNNKWPRNKCPYCGTIYRKINKKHEDKESWVFICPDCKSTLKILKE